MLSLIHKFCLLLLLTLMAGTTLLLHAGDEYIIQHRIKLNAKTVYDAALTPDNRFIVSLSGSHSLQIWLANSAMPMKTISSSRQKGISLILHPKEPIYITGGEDHTIELWDAAKGKSSGVLRGHLGAVTALAINAEGTMLYSGSEDGALLSWDLVKLTLISTINKAHQGKINAIDLHRSGKIIASAGGDMKIRTWNVETGNKITELSGHAGEITALKFHPEGEYLATSSQDKSIILWHWRDQKLDKTFVGHENAVSAIDFHPNGAVLLSSSFDGSIKLWDVMTGKVKDTIQSSDGPLVKAHFDTSGNYIIAAVDKGLVQTWQLGPSSFLGSLKGHERSITGLSFSKNGKYLVSTSLDQTMKIWEISKQEVARTYPTENHRVNDLIFSRDNRSIITAGADSNIILWDSQNGTQSSILKGHSGKVNAISMHPTQNILLSGGSEQIWILWSLDSQKSIMKKQGHEDQIKAVLFNNLGTQFATASDDKKIKIWSYPNGESLDTLEGHKKQVTQLAFSPTDDVLASASDDNVIKIWEIAPNGKAKLRFDLPAHEFIISKIIFSKDGQVLISASRDKTVKLWDVNKGNMIQVLAGVPEPISTMSVTADGKLIALGTMGKNITLLTYPLSLAEVSMKKQVEQKKNAKGNQADSTQGDGDQDGKDGGDQDGKDGGEGEKKAEDSVDTGDMASVEIPKEVFRSYDVKDEDAPIRQRDALRKELNQLMKVSELCKVEKRLEATANALLLLAPGDQAVYHALLRIAMMRQDMGLIFVYAKIGVKASFDENNYDYTKTNDVKNAFQYWIESVFDQAKVRQNINLNITVKSCKGEYTRLELGEIFKMLDIPHEVIKKILSTPNMIEFGDFAKLQPQEFNNRLLNTVQKIFKDPQPLDPSRTALSAQYQAPAIATGLLVLNLQRIQGWGNPSQVTFSLREGGQDWQSYTTDLDKKKNLLIPIGKYYLKVGNDILETFTLETDKKVEISVKNR